LGYDKVDWDSLSGP